MMESGTGKYLIALDAVLFDLVKLALELSLALQALLGPAYIHDFPIDLLSIHFINSLGTQTWSEYIVTLAFEPVYI